MSDKGRLIDAFGLHEGDDIGAKISRRKQASGAGAQVTSSGIVLRPWPRRSTAMMCSLGLRLCKLTIVGHHDRTLSVSPWMRMTGVPSRGPVSR